MPIQAVLAVVTFFVVYLNYYQSSLEHFTVSLAIVCLSAVLVHSIA